jgi:FtsZ-binding cell division protein ZapB
MEHAHTIKQFKEIYKYYKENPTDKQFENEYSREIALYKVAATELLKTYKQLPDTKEILAELDTLQEKKNTLMQEYSESKTNMDDLFTIRKNFEQYMGKEMER